MKETTGSIIESNEVGEGGESRDEGMQITGNILSKKSSFSTPTPVHLMLLHPGPYQILILS